MDPNFWAKLHVTYLKAMFNSHHVKPGVIFFSTTAVWIPFKYDTDIPLSKPDCRKED